MPALLELRRVTTRFGSVAASDGVSLLVGQGRICGIVGPNGSGKTLCSAAPESISRPDAGEVLFEGRRVVGVPRHRLAGLGISATFQNLALFGSMTVRGEVLVGVHRLGRSGFAAHALRLPLARREAEQTRAHLGPLWACMASPARSWATCPRF